MQDCFWSTGSRILYLEGGGETIANGKSIASVLGQHWTAYLQDGGDKDLAGGLVLNWFCECHAAKDAYDMTLDLIGQLIRSSKASLPIPDCIPHKEGRKNIKDTVDELTKLRFAQLQHTNVYCIIDSINTYQDRERGTNTSRLLEGLRGLVSRTTPDNAKHHFKLMVTSPSYCWRRFMSPGRSERLELPKCRSTSQGSTKAKTWSDLKR